MFATMQPMTAPQVVYLHIGAPKTGTTFLQRVVWANRDLLAERGVYLPGNRPMDHFRAGFDLRGVAGQNPIADLTGRWEELTRQVASSECPSALVSDERLAACTEGEVRKAVQSLQPAQVKVVYSVRAPVDVLSSAWQEAVKSGSAQTFERWFTPVQEHRRDNPIWFWQTHDVADVIGRWTSVIDPSAFHILTCPPPGAAKSVLWERFASVLDLEPGGVDLDVRPNYSLGTQEVEFLRRLNREVPADYPIRYARRITRDMLGNRILALREDKEKIRLPQHALEWAEEYTDEVIATLNASPCPIVGEAEDLRRKRRDTPPGEATSLPEVPPVAWDALTGLMQRLGKRDDQRRALAVKLKKARTAKTTAERKLAHEKRRRVKAERARAAALRDREEYQHYTAMQARRIARLEKQADTPAGSLARDRRAKQTQETPPLERLKRAVVDLGDESRAVNYALRVWRLGKRLAGRGAPPRGGPSR